jgi:carboxylesterase type B
MLDHLMTNWRWACIAIIACVPSDVAAVHDMVAEVHTSNGIVHGTDLPHGVHEFLGMKFATAGRYEPPVDFIGTYSQQPLQAFDYAPACMQVGDSNYITYGSEDCLYANVWKPSSAKPGDKLGVIVFIYGGSNQFGETEPYNGSAVVSRQNVIFVSIAYRTGPIGWMVFEEDIKAGRATGTWGSLDQQAGLRWVQREIHNFGGDPSRVVIQGQSSGAMCVELHMVMPGSRGLLHGLISESGGLAASDSRTGVRTSEAIGKIANCSGPSLKKCLQRVDAVTITSQTYSFGWGPHVDNVTIPAAPMQLLQRGLINNVSVLMGAQTNDSNKGLVEYAMKVEDYEASIRGIVGRRLEKHALALYPPDYRNLVQNVHTLGSAQSDDTLCGIRRRVDLVNQKNPGRAFMYRFNYWYQSNPKCSADPNYHDNTTGPRHEDEVTFVMGQPIFMFDGACCGKWGKRLKREPCDQKAECVACWNPRFGEGYHVYFNDKEWEFSNVVGKYWADFARHGNPSGLEDGELAWPVFVEGHVTRNIVLDANLPGGSKQEGTLYDNPAICSFWDMVAMQSTDIGGDSFIFSV